MTIVVAVKHLLEVESMRSREDALCLSDLGRDEAREREDDLNMVGRMGWAGRQAGREQESRDWGEGILA